MAIDFRHALDVAAAPERVFGILDDLARTPEWLERCTGIEKLSDGPNAVGTKLRYGYREGGQTGTMEGEITARQANERLAMRYSDRMMEVSVDFRVAGNGRGTRLQHDISIRPKGLMGKVASPIIRRKLPDQTIAAMEKLKGLAERDASAAGPAR
jgi:carbon monoxide dehydrogenase subunit G